jgi:hypothetical protein
VIQFRVEGEAVPYTRMTQGQVKLMRIPDSRLDASAVKVKEKIRRYLRWKDWVYVHSGPFKFDRSPKTKTYLNVYVYFSNKKHADPENVRKGIQDALFNQDKLVAGSVDFGYDPEKPRCEIEIIEEAV